jgi:hypothetical protein
LHYDCAKCKGFWHTGCRAHHSNARAQPLRQGGTTSEQML